MAASWLRQRSFLLLIIGVLNVVAASSIDGATITISDSDGKSVESLPGDSGKARLTLDHTQTLQVTFSISGNRPDQVLLRLEQGEDVAAYFTPSISTSDDTAQYTISATVAAAQKQLGIVSGPLTAAVVTGGGSTTYTEKQIATLELQYAPSDDGKPPVVQPTTKPEILHMFRPDQKQASVVFSLPFTVIGILPTVAMLAAASLAGKETPKLSGLSTSSLVFHIGVLAILVLYIVFWVGVSLLDILPWVTGLGLATTIAFKTAYGGQVSGGIKTSEKAE